MDLTAEQFANVLKSLGAERKSTERDKRRATRVNHRCRASIVLGTDIGGPRTSVTVKDLSPRGICLLRREAMPRGSNFIINLTRRGSDPVCILCTVVHCRSVSAELHSIGTEFTCVLEAPRESSPAQSQSDLDRIRGSVLA